LGIVAVCVTLVAVVLGSFFLFRALGKDNKTPSVVQAKDKGNGSTEGEPPISFPVGPNSRKDDKVREKDPKETPKDDKPPRVDTSKEIALADDLDPDLDTKLIAAINDLRRQAGRKPVVHDPNLSKGCVAHARYLARNAANASTWKVADSETPTLPGFSSLGREAGRKALNANQDPLAAIEKWAGDAVASQRLLNPNLQRIGVGYAKNAQQEWASVLDCASGMTIDRNWVVIYPVDGEKHVPLYFPGNEIPDPLPDTTEKLAGYPITVTFAPQTRVRDVHAELKEKTGLLLSVWLSSPEKPANPRHANVQGNTICLIAKKPLRPGTTYTVSVQATVSGQDWSRTWSFTTLPQTEQDAAMSRQVIDRINLYRKQAGLNPVLLDADSSAVSSAHARYLSRNVPVNANLNWNDEDLQLPEATPDGKQLAPKVAIRMGGGPNEVVDWMFASFFNRHFLLEPSLQHVGVGYAVLMARGWTWVLHVRVDRPTGPAGDGMFFPADGQKEVPIGYPMRSRPVPLPEGHQDHEAGYAITVRFPGRTVLTQVSAAVADGTGMDVPAWLSTPEKPAANQINQNWIGLIPREPLKENTTYRVTLRGQLRGQPWEKTWRFSTVSDTPELRAHNAEEILRKVNSFRAQVGLTAVEIDPELSRGCELHARFIARNFSHPSTQGLGMHEESSDLPGYTQEGRRAGQASVIASDPNPLDCVESWMSTIYHRIPLLHPELTRIGIGYARLPDQNWLSVVDCGSSRRGR
jgi:uncharacterized protein YkwD